MQLAEPLSSGICIVYKSGNGVVFPLFFHCSVLDLWHLEPHEGLSTTMALIHDSYNQARRPRREYTALQT